MYLTAMRVRHRSAEEIKALLYTQHGSWAGAPPPEIPDQRPGVLVARRIAVEEPGGVVRSYLDLVAPDDVPLTELENELVRFVTTHRSAPLPWQGVSGRCAFRFGLELGLTPSWREEVAALWAAARDLFVCST